ncbi:hypothetical protein M6G65_31950 [Methylobacterium tardum]|uniref:hypothetical protein n=1 Tax=Methylobacterium tardum TaxID=374432 RepID=UPI0020221A19|nr:hypothetical protein [Methylobacterium tardum]URD36864.1 hypothetical protein M6G65_31950 [Methylobacterium tardum]
MQAGLGVERPPGVDRVGAAAVERAELLDRLDESLDLHAGHERQGLGAMVQGVQPRPREVPPRLVVVAVERDRLAAGQDLDAAVLPRPAVLVGLAVDEPPRPVGDQVRVAVVVLGPRLAVEQRDLGVAAIAPEVGDAKNLVGEVLDRGVQPGVRHVDVESERAAGGPAHDRGDVVRGCLDGPPPDVAVGRQTLGERLPREAAAVDERRAATLPAGLREHAPALHHEVRAHGVEEELAGGALDGGRARPDRLRAIGRDQSI